MKLWGFIHGVTRKDQGFFGVKDFKYKIFKIVRLEI